MNDSYDETYIEEINSLHDATFPNNMIGIYFSYDKRKDIHNCILDIEHISYDLSAIAKDYYGNLHDSERKLINYYKDHCNICNRCVFKGKYSELYEFLRQFMIKISKTIDIDDEDDELDNISN
jgi:hypothetical protein